MSLPSQDLAGRVTVNARRGHQMAVTTAVLSAMPCYCRGSNPSYVPLQVKNKLPYCSSFLWRVAVRVVKNVCAYALCLSYGSWKLDNLIYIDFRNWYLCMKA